MAYGFKITGIENINKAIEEKRAEIKEIFEKGLNEGADRVRAKATSNAPVLSGNLKAAIDKNEFRERNDGIFSIYVGVEVNSVFLSPDGMYARMQETGTSRMPAQPYLRPAFDGEKKGINDSIVNDLKGILK